MKKKRKRSAPPPPPRPPPSFSAIIDHVQQLERGANPKGRKPGAKPTPAKFGDGHPDRAP